MLKSKPLHLVLVMHKTESNFSSLFLVTQQNCWYQVAIVSLLRVFLALFGSTAMRSVLRFCVVYTGCTVMSGKAIV